MSDARPWIHRELATIQLSTVSWLTIKMYVGSAAPVRREAVPRARPVWATVPTRVDALLAESARWTGGKRQLTATRLHALLVAEGHRIGVTVVKTAVANHSAFVTRHER